MQLFYNKYIQKTDKQFAFDILESKHIIRVLRKKENDILFITNGNGYLFKARINSANAKKCIVEILNCIEKEIGFNYNLHIAIAPTKNNQRLEWFLEKATEIGINEITPIICANSERKVVKTERLNKVIVAAMKQANSFYLPKLNEPISFKEFINTKREGSLFIAHCEETNKKSLKSKLLNAKIITILIGPEGDFSKQEIEQTLQNNYIPVSLGKSRLRTETAGIVAVHSVAFSNE